MDDFFEHLFKNYSILKSAAKRFGIDPKHKEDPKSCKYCKSKTPNKEAICRKRHIE